MAGPSDRHVFCPAWVAVNLVSPTKFMTNSNAGFLTSDGRPRDASTLTYNQRSGVFGQIVESVANRSAAATRYVQWVAADPASSGAITYGLGTLGQIAVDTLSLDADPRLMTYPTSTGFFFSPAELPMALNYEALEDLCFGCAALGVKIVTLVEWRPFGRVIRTKAVDEICTFVYTAL